MLNDMETNRIFLRPWHDSDARILYKWASDPDVGPRAGWAPHQSVEESLEVIRTVFKDATNTWAIELKETGEAIGAEDYAWIKTPAIPGKTLKQVVVVCAKGRGTGYVNLSASVDPSTGKGGCEFTSDTAFSIRDTQYFNAYGAAENTSYYICFSKALNLGIASIDLYYE